MHRLAQELVWASRIFERRAQGEAKGDRHHGQRHESEGRHHSGGYFPVSFRHGNVRSRLRLRPRRGPRQRDQGRAHRSVFQDTQARIAMGQAKKKGKDMAACRRLIVPDRARQFSLFPPEPIRLQSCRPRQFWAGVAVRAEAAYRTPRPRGCSVGETRRHS